MNKKKCLKLIKKYHFLCFFTFISAFLLIFYFTILSYFNNLIQNYNFVDEVPNDQIVKTNNNNNYFHSFLADSYKNYGVYNLKNNKNFTFNGNVNHLLHYNNDNLDLSAWKNEEINAQLILIKKEKNQILNNLTIKNYNHKEIKVKIKWMNFIDATNNYSNVTLTSYNQKISDRIEEDTTNFYQWNNKYQILPVWIIINSSSIISQGIYPINIEIEINHKTISSHIINLKIINHNLINLFNQNYYNLDLWQNFERVINYYEVLTKKKIIINSSNYWHYIEPFLKHLIKIGVINFNFNINLFLKINLVSNNLTFSFDPNLKITDYLKKITSYGFKEITLKDFLLDYESFSLEMNNSFNLKKLTKDQLLNGYYQYQKFVYNYFKKNKLYFGDNFPKIFINFDEKLPKKLETIINNFNFFPGKNSIFFLSCDVNYPFWSKNILNILSKFDKVSISYSYLNFLDDKTSKKVINFVDSREQEHKQTSIYSCTGDYPANFIKSQPSESAIIPLYGLRHHIHNFLHWSYTIWPLDWSKSGIINADEKNTGESGDLYLVYPINNIGKINLSVRMQLLTYGVEQAIKLEILKTTQLEKINGLINNLYENSLPTNFKPNWNLFTIVKSKKNNYLTQFNQLINNLNKL